jgi:hypothetical protein
VVAQVAGDRHVDARREGAAGEDRALCADVALAVMARIVKLDFWFGDEDAERYRMRRRRRTRVPLGWDDLIDVRLVPMGLAAFGTVVIGSIESSSVEVTAGRRRQALPWVAIGVVAISAVLRYLRRQPPIGAQR